jgi:hypothetical protein
MIYCNPCYNGNLEKKKKKKPPKASILKPRLFSFSFLVSNLWSSHIGDNPQENLAKFGYKQDMKIRKIKNLVIL